MFVSFSFGCNSTLGSLSDIGFIKEKFCKCYTQYKH